MNKNPGVTGGATLTSTLNSNTYTSNSIKSRKQISLSDFVDINEIKEVEEYKDEDRSEANENKEN